MRRERIKDNLLPPPPPPPVRQIESIESNRTERPLKLSTPWLAGYMSVDVHREYHNDLSQLKYLTSIPQGRLHFDLNHNIDKAVKRTTDDNDEKITLMLKYILDNKNRLKSLISEEVTFVTYRRSLISVMCNIYSSNPVTIVASLFNNCIYLCSMETPQEMLQRKSNSGQDKFCAWGYKFEQYMLSDLPNCQPDIDKPVLENEEFSMYYVAQLGKHRLFYGAQIDGMLATNGSVKDIPETDNVDTNLAFLRKNCFVELKTNKEIHYSPHLHSFRKYKLLRCWCQCYLAGLKGLLVGYRNSDGIIKRVEWFDTARIVRVCQGKWTPQKTINYLDSFLSFVKESFNSIKAELGESYDSSKPLMLKFDIDDSHRFSVTKTNDEGHIILPSWYVENIQK